MRFFRSFCFVYAIYIGIDKVIAQEYMESIQKCIVSSTTQEENDQIARWVFATLSLNPAIHSIYEIPADKMTDIRQKANDASIALLTRHCHNEIVAVARSGHKDAVHNSIVYKIRISFKSLTEDPRILDGVNSESILIAHDHAFQDLVKEITEEKK